MEVRPGYKQTEVGVIPEEWDVRTLNSLSIISRLAGAEYTSLWKETPNGEIIALRGFNIGQGQIIERDFVRISNKLSLKLKRSRLCKGDVVYPCVGSIGNAVVITDDAKYHIQQNIARITPNPAAIDSVFLAIYLMSSLAEREVARFTSSSSQPSVLVGSLRQYRVPLPPPLSEQRAIATALSDVDSLLDALDRLITKKRDIKQAAMEQLLTRGTRLPGFEGEWVESTLGELCREITDGTHYTPHYVEQGIPFYSVENITQNNFQQTKFITAAEHEALTRRCKPERDDILMTRIGSLGETKLIDWDVNGSIYVSLALLKPRDDVSSEFIYTYTKSRQFIRDVESRSLLNASPKKINMDAIQEVPVFLPPTKAEQAAISAAVFDMGAEIASLEQRRAKTTDLKQATMQELLTGKTRLVKAGASNA